ncbi:hypothetical protein BGY98DRAFT_930282 [Russula aff. rugulosa BPL654]|nr:hypothetical protein BGY98DRAFT_930282 [Russula aff. rugulosa BPL654]
MPEINRNGGDAQPGADNCVIDGHSQSAHSAGLHTPDAGIWTSEALSAPTSRHLRGEAWPREHMHVEYERSGTERAGVQVADDQPSSALRYSLLPFSPPVARRDHSMAMLIVCWLCLAISVDLPRPSPEGARYCVYFDKLAVKREPRSRERRLGRASGSTASDKFGTICHGKMPTFG